MINDILLLLVEASTSIFEIILVLSFLNGFLTGKDIPFVRKTFVIIAGFILIFAGSSFLSGYSFAVMLNYFIVSVILSFVLYDGKVFHRIFSCVLLLALLLVAEFISVYLLVLVLDFDPIIIQVNPSIRLAGSVIKNLISFFAIKIICNNRKSHVRDTGRLYFGLLLIVPVISIFVTIIIFELARSYNNAKVTIIMFAFLGLMYINAIVFAIFESITRHFDREYQYKMAEKQLELQISHYNKLAESRETLFETIHDFKNHLNCIYNLYKYNKENELRRYIENLINLSDTEKIIDTGNPVIDALLNDKSTIAEKSGIKFNRMLNLPSNINIAYNDICAILGNSLDNAIEACNRIENQSICKVIDLSMNYRDTYLVIVVANTFDQPPLRDGRYFRSSKVNPALHGLGMQSIERTVKKYNGNMVVKYDKSQFALEIVMATA